MHFPPQISGSVLDLMRNNCKLKIKICILSGETLHSKARSLPETSDSSQFQVAKFCHRHRTFVLILVGLSHETELLLMICLPTKCWLMQQG